MGERADMTRYLRIVLPADRGRAARRGRILPGMLCAALVLASLTALAAATAPAARAATLPTGFQESVVFSGLTNPTAVRFTSDGRVFVAEKRGVIKVFDSLSDPTPDVFADLNVNVYNFWDRGLLGMALDPNFPATPTSMSSTPTTTCSARPPRRRAGGHPASTPTPARPPRGRPTTAAWSAGAFRACRPPGTS
jgi:hypothetical protein